MTTTSRTATLRLGTRGSALALAQSGMVADALRALGATVELVTIRTAGDDRAPNTAWGEGAFVMALEGALLDGRVDVAVHSAKDVPTAEDPRLAVAAFPPREDPRDALVCREQGTTLQTLPPGALVGTDSPRRVAFLRAHRPDLRTRPLHGNVDTRLRKLADGEADALVLAVAGLARLGLADRISQAIGADLLPPAPGQGALAVQVRADDAVARSLVGQLDDAGTRAAVEAERAFLRASGGGCRAPLGALAQVDGDEIVIRGGAAAEGSVPDGDAPAIAAALAPGTTFTGPSGGGQPAPRVAWAERRGPVAYRAAIAAELAAALAAELAAGAAPPASRSRQAGGPPRVLLTREPGQPGDLAGALAARGLDPVVVPTIELRPAAPGGALDAAVADLAGYAWVVVTSATGADAVAAAAGGRGARPAAARAAAAGPAAAAAVAARGGLATFLPSRATAATLADELPLAPGDRVLVARADAADGALPARLRERGARVDDIVAYHTVEGPEPSRRPLRAAIDGGVDAIVATSGSTVRGLLALLPPAQRRMALQAPVACIGPSTAAAAREAGFLHVVEAPAPSPKALAELVASFFAGAPADQPTEVSR